MFYIITKETFMYELSSYNRGKAVEVHAKKVPDENAPIVTENSFKGFTLHW